MSTRDFSWGKGGRCIRLTTYHPRSAERQENPGPYPTRKPLGHLGLLWETFTFTIELNGYSLKMKTIFLIESKLRSDTTTICQIFQIFHVILTVHRR